ncbi:RING/U-box superfamily protein [Actinidia rufa]|uniref:RING/U-box superfamily protein n=1 Tax=Actinidia rufa TaxID=165716 RepID=A0A7J0DS14_9ERIC|nr:RING/U-box superfamily protein [Actinidia rufa]
MNRSIFLFLIAIFWFLDVEAAQSPPSQDDLQSQDAVTNFQPSLAVVIGILAIMFSLTFVLLVYAKFCHRASSPVHNNPHSLDGLIRHKISAEDLAFLNYSNSLRFLSNQSEAGDESNMELFVQREEDHHQSSRFGSFRKVDRGKNEEELPIQENCDGSDADDENRKLFHKFNHTIIVSDVLKNRWSNVSSSDLMFLNSEMLRTMSSNRFASLGPNTEQSLPKRVVEGGNITRIKEEMGRKREFETKVGKMSQIDSFPNNSTSNSSYGSRVLNPNDKRSMSEITVHPRFKEFGVKNSISESSLPENDPNEERVKRLWLPIAQRTVHWFANREKTRQSLNV